MRWCLVLGLLALLATIGTACGRSQAPPTATPTVTVVPTTGATATLTPSQTPTATPAATPTPTPSPALNLTAVPTPFPTPAVTQRPTTFIVPTLSPVPASSQADSIAQAMPMRVATYDIDTPLLPLVTVDVIAEYDVHYGPDNLQKLDVYYHRGQSSAPVIISVHGGGWMGGSKERAELDTGAIRGLLGLGFIVVTPNYRLTTLNSQHTFPTPVEDVACAVVWTVNHAEDFGGDPQSVIIMGGSAGAHIGALLAYNPERGWLSQCDERGELPRFKGFIGRGGVYDFNVTSGERWRPGCLLMDLLTLESCGPDDFLWKDGNPTLLAEASPISFVSEDDPPALLATGEKDCFVNPYDPVTGKCIANSANMAMALDQVGVDNTVLVFPGRGHGLKVSLSRTTEFVNFLEKYVGPTIRPAHDAPRKAASVSLGRQNFINGLWQVNREDGLTELR